MKIKDTKVEVKKEFGELEPGDCFRDSDSIFMVIYSNPAEQVAVNLETGSVKEFCSCDEVYPVDATLTVK